MRVFLLNPPFLPRYSRSQRSPAVIKSGTLYYPIWLAYATGVLEQAGHDCRLIDAPAKGYSLETVLSLAQAFRPQLVVMDTSTPSIYGDAAVAAALKDAVPGACVVLVGTHPTALPEETLGLSPKIDAVTRREYDHTLRELAEVLEGGGEPSGVLGLSYRRPGDGAIAHNPTRPLIRNLDELPFVSAVYKKHLRIEDYFYSITPHPVVTIVTGRGCPYRCTYCLYPQTMHGHGYRYRSVESVVEEMAYIARAFPQAQQIFLEDDTLTVNRKRCVELSEGLIDRGVKVGWTANSRADVDYQTLKKMKQAGCRLLCVGFESASQQILDNIQKRITVDRFRQFARDAKRAGVMVHGCFMFGCPGETRETMEATLQLAKELAPDTAQFFPLMVYPGTAAYRWAKEEGHLATEDFSRWLTPEGQHNAVVSRPDLRAEDLVAFADYARRSFYLRPRYVLGKLVQGLRHPEEAKRIFISFRAFRPYLLRRARRSAVSAPPAADSS